MNQQDSNGREEIPDRFDEAWRKGKPVRLDQFVQANLDICGLAGPARHELLAELIKIDMEYRWRDGPSSDRPHLEDYLRDFPELGPLDRLSPELIGEEYQVRQRWGDKPNHDEYAARFRGQVTKLREVLQRIDTYLAAEAPGKDGILSLERGSGKASPCPSGLGRPIQSATALVETLRQYRLLGPAQLDELARDLRGRFQQPRALAKELLRRNWLTPYQVNQLLAGRGSELVLGPYLLLQRLGEGGAGQVFKARHQTMNRLAALKIIRQELLDDDEMVARFRREFQVLSRLNHPNVVQAYDAGTADTRHFLAMEYVEGTDLAKLVKQCGPLPVMQACAYIRQAAQGLQHAHERGLVHRDIKPHNLIMSLREGRIKVADLGLARLAKATNEEMTAAATGARTAGTLTPIGAVMMGTADYLAPEQALDFHQADIRADIYSLGCTLWYLLTGRPLFPADTLAEKLVRHQTKEPPAIKRFRPDVPPGLAGVLRQMLEKRPEDRYRTPAEVAAALLPYARSADEGDLEFDPGGWSFRAQARTTWTMLRKFVRRNKAFSAALAAALILLTWSSVVNYQARRRYEGEHNRTVKAVPVMVAAARLSVEKRRFDDALTHVNMALDYDPDCLEARLLKGQLLIVQRKFVQAKQELERWLGKQPGDKGIEKLVRLCGHPRPDEDSTILQLAYTFEEELSMPILAEGLLKPIATSSHDARIKLMKLYQDRIDKRWPRQKGFDWHIQPDPNGIYVVRFFGPGGAVKDLDVLQGMALTQLHVLGTDAVPDLEPLRGMPLASLSIRSCGGIRDLSPLKGMPLTSLNLEGCWRIEDLSPLKGMPLNSLSLFGCNKIDDLSPLKGMPVASLNLFGCVKIDDLSPLKGMPVASLNLSGCVKFDDLSPLKGMNLKRIILPPKITKGMDALRGMKSLTSINGLPPAKFWEQYKAAGAIAAP